MYRVVYGDGLGGFAGFHDVAALREIQLGTVGNSLLVHDFNDDAIDDFAGLGPHFEIYAGSATKQHAALYRQFDINAQFGAPGYIVSLDGSAKWDLVVQSGSSLQVHIDEQLDFSESTIVSGTEYGASQVMGVRNFLPGDFDHDGLNDLLVIGGTQTAGELALGLFAGMGDGSFTPPGNLIPLSSQLWTGQIGFESEHKEMTAADFDGDGDLDVMLSSTTDFLQVMLNDGNGNFNTGQRVRVGNGPIHIKALDLNLDSIQDVVSVNQISNTITLHYGRGDGTFGDSTGGQESWLEIRLDNDVEPADLAVADLNSDQYPDLILAEIGSRDIIGAGSIQIFLSPGMGGE